MFLRIPSFIEKYDNALTHKECDTLIDYFEESNKIEGQVFLNNEFVVNNSLKKSLELEGCNFSNNDLLSSIIGPSLCRCIEKYDKKYKCLSHIDYWKYNEEYTFKKFESEEDGFKVWHTEHGARHPSSSRILVWSYYLNNAKSGTEFMNYGIIKAKKGRCVIWPSSFTHLHRSEYNRGLKYIISGWISYI